MRLIDCDAIVDALDDRRVVEALRRGHQRGVDATDRMLLSEGDDPARANHFLCLPAWQYGEFFGAKLVNVFPANAPKPTIATVYVLFDGSNGAPLAAIHGAEFTLRKTAADSALGASFLARHDVRTLLMVGAGSQAPHQIRALCAVRPSLDRVAVWNRSPARARRLADDIALDRVEIAAVEDLEAAARRADLICCATSATEPLLMGAWLKPGTHVDLVGGFTNDMREADDATIARATVFVDTRWNTVGLCGDISGPIAAGIISADDIAADLFELSSGRHPGRRSDDEITVFKNAGGGHLDLMMARLVHEVAGG